jgi:hypothetical protein
MLFPINDKALGTYELIQYDVGFTPATVCKCFALLAFSDTIKVPNVPDIKGKLNTSRNHAENDASSSVKSSST